MNAKFQIFKSNKNNQFYFRLRATNNEIILSSEGYTTKYNCENGINSVKAYSPYDAYYQRLIATNGQHYFTLKSANNQVIGMSEFYISAQGRDNGIESVKRNAPTAEVQDLTLNTLYN